VKGLGQGFNFNRVPQGGGGAVGFHIANGVGRKPRLGLGSGDRLGLTDDTGGGEADFVSPIVVHTCAVDDGVDAIAIPLSIGQPLQRYHRRPIIKQGALGIGIKGPTVAIAGEHAALLVEVTTGLGGW
jgi:hypothetical protein